MKAAKSTEAEELRKLVRDAATGNGVVLPDKWEKWADKHSRMIMDVKVLPLSAGYLNDKNKTRRNVVEIDREFAEGAGLLNNQVVYVVTPDGMQECTVFILSGKGMERPSLPEIRLPLRIRQMMSPEVDKVMVIIPKPYICNRVIVQSVTEVESDAISISGNCYDNLMAGNPKSVLIRDLKTGATIIRRADEVRRVGPGNPEGATIKLNRNQRRSLNLYNKDYGSRSEEARFRDIKVLKDKIIRTADIAETDSEGCDCVPGSTDIFGKSDAGETYCLQLVPCFEKQSGRNIKTVIGDFLVGKSEMRFMAVRPYAVDDTQDLVRLSSDAMTLLGIQEADRVIVQYRGRKYTARVLEMDSPERMRETNIIGDDLDLNMVIGIPAPIRKKLGIYDVENEVLIKRDTWFLFIKNINVQILPILGVILAIQFEVELQWKIVICLGLMAIFIWMSLSQERSKVKKVRRS